MIIEYCKDPAPHYIIDEFLTPRAAKEILQECIDLEPFYSQATVMGDHHEAPEPDKCDLCKSNSHKLRNMIRDNQTVSLDNLYEKKREKSKCLSFLHDKLYDLEFKQLMEDSESIFPIMNAINSSEMMLSRYGKCDFYGWHTDSLHPNTESRVITISYYVNKEPLKFKGGGLLIMGKDNKIKRVEPKHNRAVIFPSRTAVHSVEYVDLSGKTWEEGRFSVQFWTGFNNKFKFR